MRKKTVVQGALILTLANIITRILGFVYRIYMSNVIGAEGMGLYQLIMPIYMLVWSISSSGFQTTISKLTAQENAKNNYGNMGQFLKQSLFTSTLIAFALSLIVFTFADHIAVIILKDERTAFSLKLISLCFPFMAAGSCIRGYFLGLQETTVPALSQVLEQISRMSVIFFLASVFIPKGIEYACAVAVIGMGLGEFFAFTYVFASYIRFKKSNKLLIPPTINPIKSYSIILLMATPLTLNRVTGSFLSTVENVLIPQMLQRHGLNASEAIGLYGQLSGMAMPLLMFPSSFLTAIAIALTPAISEAKAVKNATRIKHTVSKAMQLTSIIGLGSCGLFLTFPHELGFAIYHQTEIGNILYMLGFICPFLYMQVTLSGILNGLGEQMFIFKNSIIVSAITILFIYWGIPRYGLPAFIVGWTLAAILVSALSFKRVLARTFVSIDLFNWAIKPSLCIVFTSLISKFIFNNYLADYSDFASVSITVVLFGGMYAFLLTLTGCITTKDIKQFISNF